MAAMWDLPRFDGAKISPLWRDTDSRSARRHDETCDDTAVVARMPVDSLAATDAGGITRRRFL